MDTFNKNVAGLTPQERAQVGRGSYVVNAGMHCNRCHTLGSGVESVALGSSVEDGDINVRCYLAGKVSGTGRHCPLAFLTVPNGWRLAYRRAVC